MAKGGQGKGKAKGKNKSSGGVKPMPSPAPIVTPARITRIAPLYRAPYGTTRYERPIGEPVDLRGTPKKKKTMKRRVGSMANSAYCMKCRRKVEIKNPRMVVMRNGRPAISGTCPYCGTKVFKIGK